LKDNRFEEEKKVKIDTEGRENERKELNLLEWVIDTHFCTHSEEIFRLSGEKSEN
jgi:hypothetical protein